MEKDLPNPPRDICKAIDRGKKKFITSANAAQPEDVIEHDQPTCKLPPKSVTELRPPELTTKLSSDSYMHQADYTTNSNTTHAPLYASKHAGKCERTHETASQVAKAVSPFINRSMSPNLDVTDVHTDRMNRVKSASVAQKHSATTPVAENSRNKSPTQRDYTGSDRPAHQWWIIALELTMHHIGRDPNLLRAAAGRYNLLIPCDAVFYCKRVETDSRCRSERILTLASRFQKQAPPTLDQRWKAMLLSEHQLRRSQADARVFLEEDFPEIIVHQLSSGATPPKFFPQNSHVTAEN